MKKMITIIFLGIIGILNIQAQTGTVNRTFIMEGYDSKIDTCNLSLTFNNGSVTALVINMNYKNKTSFIAAVISGEANRYHRYKNVETRINDFKKVLANTQEKYQEWSSTAKENKIVSYQKIVGEYKDIPLFSLAYYINNVAYHPLSDWPYISTCTPIFLVDEKGECSIKMKWGSCEFERIKGYNQGFWTSYPIKENVICKSIFFIFRNPMQLQSLIDALDIETAKQELLNKSESKKDLDKLFK